VELDKYLGLFIDESKDNLQKLNESLLKLEENPDNLDLLNDIFRVAHTLKGMSKTMGYNDIGDLTHNMENVLDPMRNGTLKATPSVVDILFKCLDKLEGLVGLVINNNYSDSNNDIADLVKELNKIEHNLSPDKTSSKTLAIEFNQYELTLINNSVINGLRAVEITVTLVDDCVLPAVRAYMVVNSMESKGELIKTSPVVEELENGDFEKVFKLFLLTENSDNELIKTINGISEIKNVTVELLDISKATNQKNTDPSLSEEKEDDESKAAQRITSSKVVSQTIRVNADKLDKLMNLVGELVINRTRISELSNNLKIDDLSASVSLMGNITTDLQEIVMKLRMVPIEQVFNRFPRLVRDISKTFGKEINLIITGKETEIDRIVIDEISDPLVHLIRNSLDHGLETPAERINTGKSSKGTLELSAFNEGDNIIIKVVDDGRGIDPEKIKAKAIQKGIIDKEAAAKLAEKEILELIFRPGFSTMDVATDISGRGVGMDVVKQKVTALGGNVQITSKTGIGTTMTISLPSTMAIVQALLIKIGKEIYATPLNYISEVIDIEQKQIKNIQNKEVIVLRGNTLPLVRMNKVLQVPDYMETPDQMLTVVIVKSQNTMVGLIVSELIGQQEVVIKPVSKKLCSEDYISGATTLGDGKVALILNVNALI
jgi:two-component system chemotaxis sensor kinase CheA